MIRVLIVDDDKLARKGLISIMPWSDYEMKVVGEAANGAKALEFLNENEVDLMFVDLAMPVLSGMELIKQVKEKYPDLKFVVLTFHEDFELVQSAIRLGALDYVSKIRLEIENYDEMLKRIREKCLARMYAKETGKQETAADMPRKSEASADHKDKPEILRIEKAWNDLYWLYDESIFKQLCKETAQSRMSIRRIDMLFVVVISKIEAETGLKCERWQEYDDPGSAVRRIEECRTSIHRQADQSNDLTQLPVCMLKAVDMIRDKIATPLHAEEIAASVNMSRSYFCLCFKRLIGVTFNDYLRKERINAAMTLLSQTNQSVTWVSQAVGYGDVKYFSHIFQHETNMLPSEYRIQFQGKVGV